MSESLQPQVTGVEYVSLLTYHVVRATTDEFGEVGYGGGTVEGVTDYSDWMRREGLTPSNDKLVTWIDLKKMARVSLVHPTFFSAVVNYNGQPWPFIEEIDGEQLPVGERLFATHVDDDTAVFEPMGAILERGRITPYMQKWLVQTALTNYRGNRLDDFYQLFPDGPVNPRELAEALRTNTF